MNAEVLPADEISARSLMERVTSFATLPQVEVIEQVAQLFANHRAACAPGPLAWKLDQAITALLVAGNCDDELMRRLKVARDFARNVGKERAG